MDIREKAQNWLARADYGEYLYNDENDHLIVKVGRGINCFPPCLLFIGKYEHKKPVYGVAVDTEEAIDFLLATV